MKMTMNPAIAVQHDLADDFFCMVTSRIFDNDADRPWQDAATSLLELLRSEGIAVRRMIFAGQVHGTRVEAVEDSGESTERICECDGLVTAEKGTALVIRTADCVPVVIVDPVAGVCGCLHAGWRGTIGNIVSRGIKKMKALGASQDNMRLWTGPAICRENYEVSPELIEQFQSVHGGLGDFFEGRCLDLPRLNLLQGLSEGISKHSLEMSGLCTYRHEKLFHSHRRQNRLRGHQYTVCGFLP